MVARRAKSVLATMATRRPNSMDPIISTPNAWMCDGTDRTNVSALGAPPATGDRRRERNPSREIVPRTPPLRTAFGPLARHAARDHPVEGAERIRAPSPAKYHWVGT